MEWRHIATVPDGQPFLLDGVNIWEQEWASVQHGVAVVRDPLYGQEFRFQIYQMRGSTGMQTFAAGEFSNCVWGFYIPRPT